MSLQIEIDSFDYKEAIRKVDDLLANIHCTCDNNDLKDMPSATEIVDVIWDTIR